MKASTVQGNSIAGRQSCFRRGRKESGRSALSWITGLPAILLPPLAIVAFLAGLILLQPNLSSAGLLFATGFVMLYLAEAPLLHLAVPVGAGLVTVAAMLQLHPYQMQRVATYVRFVLTGALDQRGSGWQLDQSLIAGIANVYRAEVLFPCGIHPARTASSKTEQMMIGVSAVCG